MNKGNNKLDQLKGRQPFRIPEGYFEGFAEDLMSHLPEKSVAKAKKISLSERVKPWLYMAAAFAGIMILFNIFNYFSVTPQDGNSGVVGDTASMSFPDDVAVSEEDAEFLEYIEDMYTDKYAISYIDDFYE